MSKDQKTFIMIDSYSYVPVHVKFYKRSNLRCVAILNCFNVKMLHCKIDTIRFHYVFSCIFFGALPFQG